VAFYEPDGVYRIEVLLTGGMGFIGSHTSPSHLSAGHLILYDKLSNRSYQILEKLSQITALLFPFVKGDVCDSKSLMLSGSARMYSQSKFLSLDENHPISTTNPYKPSKLPAGIH
jgi:UDP-glucose 4-epimerase